MSNSIHDTVLRLQAQIRGVICNVAPDEPADLCDDLAQEASLAILQSESGQTDAFYLQQAAWTIGDYLRKERRHAYEALPECI